MTQPRQRWTARLLRAGQWRCQDNKQLAKDMERGVLNVLAIDTECLVRSFLWVTGE